MTIRANIGGVTVLALLFVCVLVLGSPSSAAAATPAEYGLTEGDVIRAEGDLDVFIVNEHGYKRLFVNEEIFLLYGHLGFDKVKTVSPQVRDAFLTSGLFQNCEAGDERVHGLEVVNADAANLRWINTSGEQAKQDDPDFFRKVFCINNAELRLYGSGPAYNSVRDVPRYDRGETQGTLGPAAPPSGNTAESVYTSWAGSVSQMLCFEFDGKQEVSELWGGSGTLMRNRNGDMQLLTNRHVVPGDGFCLVEFWAEPGLSFAASNQTVVYAARFSGHLSVLEEDDEAVMLLEPVSDDLLKVFSDRSLVSRDVVFPRTLTEAGRIAHTNVCGAADARVGADVAVIGFPSIGSTRGPTLTLGNLSGREATYYVTDAKIERGNSGGAAVLIDKNCYLGIPTYVVAGEHESLGRILDITRFQVFAKTEPLGSAFRGANISELIKLFFEE